MKIQSRAKQRRFFEISDAQNALRILKKSKQKPDKSLQCDAQKLLSVAEEDYAGQQGGLLATEHQVIGISSDGLTHDSLQLTVKRANTDTLQAMVIFVVNM